MTKYYSLDGIYVANQYLTRDGVSTNDQIMYVYVFWLCLGFTYSSSKITFNKGGEWDLITPPELDANSQPTKCEMVHWIFFRAPNK